MLITLLLSIIIDCKNLAPTWTTLAADFLREPNVVIAKVDAEGENSKATSKAQGVSSYPTIKFFPRGSKEGQDYKGGRTEAAFIEFLNEQTGTNRAVGGGLNAKGGTIESLDAIVAKYVSGTSLEKIATEIEAAAKGLKHQYAPYYTKVVAKLQGNAEYATKELARLEKILSKGNLAPEKVDHLVARGNILRRFVGEEENVKDEL